MNELASKYREISSDIVSNFDRHNLVSKELPELIDVQRTILSVTL